MQTTEHHWHLAFGLICPIVFKFDPSQSIKRRSHDEMCIEIIEHLQNGVVEVLPLLDHYDIDRSTKIQLLSKCRNNLGIETRSKKAQVVKLKNEGYTVDEIVNKTGISWYYTDFIYNNRRRTKNYMTKKSPEYKAKVVVMPFKDRHERLISLKKAIEQKIKEGINYNPHLYEELRHFGFINATLEKHITDVRKEIKIKPIKRSDYVVTLFYKEKLSMDEIISKSGLAKRSVTRMLKEHRYNDSNKLDKMQ